MISSVNTRLVIEQRKNKVLRESKLKSKYSQELYLKLLFHFTGKKITIFLLYWKMRTRGFFFWTFMNVLIWRKIISNVHISFKIPENPKNFQAENHGIFLFLFMFFIYFVIIFDKKCSGVCFFSWNRM